MNQCVDAIVEPNASRNNKPQISNQGFGFCAAATWRGDAVAASWEEDFETEAIIVIAAFERDNTGDLMFRRPA